MKLSQFPPLPILHRKSSYFDSLDDHMDHPVIVPQQQPWTTDPKSQIDSRSNRHIEIDVMLTISPKTQVEECLQGLVIITLTLLRADFLIYRSNAIVKE